MTVKRLIGSAPSQISRNKDLGSIAFQNADHLKVGQLTANGTPSGTVGNQTSYDARITSKGPNTPNTIHGFQAYDETAVGGFILATPNTGSTSHVTTASDYDTYLTTRYAQNLILGTAVKERLRINPTGVMTDYQWFGTSQNYNHYAHKKFYFTQSQINNQTISILNAGAGTQNNALMIKVRVAQMGYLGSAGSSGNEHVGLAWIWTGAGSTTNTYVNTMTTTTVINNSNVGTLSWSGTTLQYNTNRASNYDAYFVEVEVFMNTGGGYNFTFPTSGY